MVLFICVVICSPHKVAHKGKGASPSFWTVLDALYSLQVYEQIKINNKILKSNIEPDVHLSFFPRTRVRKEFSPFAASMTQIYIVYIY